MAFLVAVEHFNVHPVARWLLDYLQCVPVSRNGRDFISLRKALKRLASGRALCIFPEGNLSGVAKNRLLPPKLGIGFLALYTRIPVYPIYVAGGPRTEKLLYSWLFPSSRSVRVIYGDPVNLEKYYNKPITRQLVVEVTESLMHEVARLAPRPSISAEADADL
jgi:1-acyl-sn-glycerol-3-phosphate acyltransferase